MKLETRLKEHRRNLKLIDYHVVASIRGREKLVLEIEKIKRKMKVPVFDEKQEGEKINLMVGTAKSLGASKAVQALIKEMYSIIIPACRKMQEEQREKADKRVKNKIKSAET
jgi:chorismate mutase